MSSGALEDDFKIGYHAEDAVSYLYGMGGEPKCCCLPAKCHMPDAITVTMTGFWGEWAHRRSGQYHSTHAGITGNSFCTNGVSPPTTVNNACCLFSDCETTVRSAWFDGRADGLLDITWYPARNVWELPEGPDGATIGEAQLCVQNPWMLTYFPNLDGDPPTPVSADAIYLDNYSSVCAQSFPSCGPGIYYVNELDIMWRWDSINQASGQEYPFEEAMADWTVSLPSCVYSFSDYAPQCHILGATAGDLDGQSAVLRRVSEQMPPVLRPLITRQRTPEDGEVFEDSQLLFDVYLRPFQESWADGDWDGRAYRYSVDYVCNPRYFPPVGNSTNVFVYFCRSPGGIVPPKLSITAASGGGGAEIKFTIDPVPGTGNSPRDTLWVVSSATVVDGGSGANVGDEFVIDFFEDPMRGGEFRDSETAQKVIVSSVDDNGAVTGIDIQKQTYTNPVDNSTYEKFVYYGRFLCHPNGVALRGSGYSEGDTIEWLVVDQPPELGGGSATEYARARAVVTEVDEKGGILDWYMPNSRHGDGDNEHTFNYDCVPPFLQPDESCLGSRTEPHQGGAPCAENHPSLSCPSDLAAVDCRGLYSDVMNIQRCSIIYEGYVGFRASAHREAATYSLCKSIHCVHKDCSCGGDSACFNNYCGINTIPIKFEVFAVETRLRVDITAPQVTTSLESAADMTVTVQPFSADDETLDLDLPPAPTPPPLEDDFIEHSDSSVSVVSEKDSFVKITGLSPRQARLGDNWMATANFSVTYGGISLVPSTTVERPRSVEFKGTVAEIRSVMNSLYYWPPENSEGSDRFVVNLTVTPPGYERPMVARAKVDSLINRCEDIPSGSIAGGIITCGDEAVLDYYLGGIWDIAKGYEYPEARPLGGISAYEVTDGGAGYAVWNHDDKTWEKAPDLTVIIGSAWDSLRLAVLNILAVDLYAHATATVDLDVESVNFGRVTSVAPEPGLYGTGEGWMYCLHEHDNMWRANLSWDFSYDMFTQAGYYITSASFPGIIHKDGYTFPATYPCDEPNLSCFGDSLMSQCADRTQPCKPYSNNHLWSFEYCPKDLFKSFEMMMPAETLQRPNTPTQLGEDAYLSQFVLTPAGVYSYSKCTNGGAPGADYEPCESICLYPFGSWCEHPSSAVTHDTVCWRNVQDGSGWPDRGYPWFPDGYIAEWPAARSTYLDFGNGPITFTIEAIEGDDGDERERSVY